MNSSSSLASFTSREGELDPDKKPLKGNPLKHRMSDPENLLVQIYCLIDDDLNSHDYMNEDEYNAVLEFCEETWKLQGAYAPRITYDAVFDLYDERKEVAQFENPSLYDRTQVL
jgi:hypothetical protein